MRRAPDAPRCWTPPTTMPPLPPGEAVRAEHWEVYGGRARFPPRTAPGYSRAAAMGLLPPAPADRPPSPVPGLSAWDRLRLGLVSFFVLVPGVWATAERLDPGTPAVLLSVVPAGASMWFFLTTTRRSRLEHEAGYTSTPDTVGLWRLARDGRVLRAPDPSVPPPGFYPSPYYPGVLQRWEGPGWAPLVEDWWDHEEQYFRRPPVPFL